MRHRPLTKFNACSRSGDSGTPNDSWTAGCVELLAGTSHAEGVFAYDGFDKYGWDVDVGGGDRKGVTNRDTLSISSARTDSMLSNWL